MFLFEFLAGESHNSSILNKENQERESDSNLAKISQHGSREKKSGSEIPCHKPPPAGASSWV